VLKSTQGISRVNTEFKPDVSEFSVSTLMMETKEISETLLLNSTLKQLVAREYFTKFIRRESFNFYINLYFIFSFEIYKRTS
jgi:hypothetical protein